MHHPDDYAPLVHASELGEEEAPATDDEYARTKPPKGRTSGALDGAKRSKPRVAAHYRPRRRSHSVLLARLSMTLMAAGALLALLVAGGSALGMFRLDVVTSAAMGKALPAGSDVVVLPESINDLKPGQVIAYTPPNPFPQVVVVDRVVWVRRHDGYAVVATKGDNLHQRDPWFLALKGTAWRTEAVLPDAGYLTSLARLGIVQLLVVLALASVVAAAIFQASLLPHGERRRGFASHLVPRKLSASHGRRILLAAILPISATSATGLAVIRGAVKTVAPQKVPGLAKAVALPPSPSTLESSLSTTAPAVPLATAAIGSSGSKLATTVDEPALNAGTEFRQGILLWNTTSIPITAVTIDIDGPATNVGVDVISCTGTWSADGASCQGSEKSASGTLGSTVRLTLATPIAASSDEEIVLQASSDSSLGAARWSFAFSSGVASDGVPGDGS